jgi:hypothetical protein
VTSPDNLLRLLTARPVSVGAAAAVLPRGPGVYAWWGLPSALPDFPGLANDAVPTLRLLYVGRAVSLRGRIVRTHLRRSADSTLRRTLAGLLMPAEGYRTTWKNDAVVLLPDDEARLTAWMRRELRLTWAEHPYPEDVEAELLARLDPPLNVHGIPDDDIRDAVLAAKRAYEASAGPAT